jgi:hypothetical protein
MVLTKRQLRYERSVLKELGNRYGNVALYDAYDRVSVELDFYRGAGVKRKGKIGDNEKEYQAWMALN